MSEPLAKRLKVIHSTSKKMNYILSQCDIIEKECINAAKTRDSYFYYTEKKYPELEKWFKDNILDFEYTWALCGCNSNSCCPCDCKTGGYLLKW